MAKHSNIHIWLLSEHLDWLDEQIKKYRLDVSLNHSKEPAFAPYAEICIGDVKDGEPPFRKELVAQAIPYSLFAGECIYNVAWCEHLRFTKEGAVVYQWFCEDERHLRIEKLMPFIDEPHTLRNTILAHYANTVPLELNKPQLEYSNIYKAKKLLIPNWGEEELANFQ
jgi:hypothetical protein